VVNFNKYLFLLTSFWLIFAGGRLDSFSLEKISPQSQIAQNKIESTSIKTINGKFYAYLVLLFNENPHFVNLIQPDAIPRQKFDLKDFHLKEYRNYLAKLQDRGLKELAQKILQIYSEPIQATSRQLALVEQELAKRNIILKFSNFQKNKINKIYLDYSIFGQKDLVKLKHPFLEIKKPIYNIRPFIYYDEFLTSNSTFYFDLVYINPDEVENDFLITKKVLQDQKVNSLFFVGSLVTEDIKYCLKKAFFKIKSAKKIKKIINEMFIIHELTHKGLNNRYKAVNQVIGEELSLCSTIYYTPYLGLAVFYSYLGYNYSNSHRLAAINFIKYIAIKKDEASYIEQPGKIKLFSGTDLKKMAEEYFFFTLKTLEINLNPEKK